MPWLVAPSVTAASPVRTPARAWMPGPSAWTASTRSSAGADGALGVVLVRDRRAPDGHDRVADELLDRAAVALDDLARQVEVARTASRARPPRRAPRRSGVKPTRSAKRTLTRRRSATAALALGAPWRGAPSARPSARRRRTGDQRRGALGAELGRRPVGRAAGRAGDGQARGALGAELRAGRVLRAAVRADHRRPRDVPDRAGGEARAYPTAARDARGPASR